MSRALMSSPVLTVFFLPLFTEQIVSFFKERERKRKGRGGGRENERKMWAAGFIVFFVGRDE